MSHNVYYGLHKCALRKLKIVFGGRVTGLADVDLIAKDAQCTQNPDNHYDYQQFNQIQAIFPHCRPLSMRI